jgi:hypothetical protein
MHNRLVRGSNPRGPTLIIASAITQGLFRLPDTLTSYIVTGGRSTEKSPAGTPAGLLACSAILLPYHWPRIGNQTGKLVKLERLVQNMVGLLVDRFGQVLVSGHDDDVNPEQPLFAADVL